MNFSLFENDGGLGRDPSDPPQLPPQCSCLHGTPVIDADGNCTCVSDLPGPLGNYGGPRTLVEHAYQTTVIPGPSYPAAQYSKDAPASGDGTIFGLSPLMLILLAGGGLWLLSSMGGTTKKTRGGEYV